MNTEENKVLQVPIEDIIPNRFQPRLSFDESSLKELAESIKQHGIIQPLVLRRIADKYEIIAGERRYKAAMMAGLVSVPAILTDLDDNASAEVAIVENVQRKDLTAIEEAKSYKALLDKGYMTQEELAKKMGLSQSAISNKLRLLSLDESVQDAILNNKISERHARSLLKVKDLEVQKQLLNRIINERLTVKQLEEEIKKMNIVEEPSENVIDSTAEEAKMKENFIEETPSVAPISPAPPTPEPVAPPTPAPAPATPTSKFGNIFASFKPAPNPNNPGTPDQIPNKFFNFLEDEAVNMSMDADTSTPVANANEDIEMLDLEEHQPIVSGVNEIVNKIRGLNLDPTKVMVSETDSPFEYTITIKIKKDN